MDDLARIAYEAYAKAAGNRSLVSGDPLPEWPALGQGVRDAWNAAAQAVAMSVLGEGTT